MSKLLYTSSDWTVDVLDNIWKTIRTIALEKYGLDHYPARLEIVTADQMIHSCAHLGMPASYSHWSFGKEYMQSSEQWAKGRQGLPLEAIINSNPAIAYIMEDNSSTMQATVLAHASIGHSNFFKNNYLFQEYTDASAVFNMLKHAKSFVAQAELAYGPDKVEKLLDVCHALAPYGVDTYQRRRVPRDADVRERRRARNKHKQESFDLVYETLKPSNPIRRNEKTQDGFFDSCRPRMDWPFPEENLLYFIEKNGPSLEQWEKEIIRIVRNGAHYFYPQLLTKVMNEGWASFWHYTLVQDLYNEGYINEGSYLEFLDLHVRVCHLREGTYEPPSPYTLGFEIFMDIKRACEDPDEEDYKYLPLVAGKPWLETLKWVMMNFKDETFIQEFLGPRVAKKLKLFCLEDNADLDHTTVRGIQHSSDLYEIRKNLAANKTLIQYYPQIEVVDCDLKDTRELVLRHQVKDKQRLDPEITKVMLKYLTKVWRHPVKIYEITEDGEVISAFTRKYQ